MPINYKLYGREFRTASSKLRREYGRCAFCGIPNYKYRKETGGKVVLTVHHLDGGHTNHQISNLAPLCQRCHLGTHQHLDRKIDYWWNQYVAFTRYKYGATPVMPDDQIDIFKVKSAQG